jgi:hypothetical protein
MSTHTTVAIMIQTDNAAFGDNPAYEVARMLDEVADRFRRTGELEPRPLRDVNGNACGEIKVIIVGAG